MKPYLPTLIILLNTGFVISETIPRYFLQYPQYEYLIENQHKEIKSLLDSWEFGDGMDYIPNTTNDLEPTSTVENIKETTTTRDQHSEETTAAEDPHNEETTTTAYPDNYNITITTEHPDNNNNSETTTHSIETTTDRDNARNCPKEQSSFSKHDIVAIMNYISINEMNIMKVISDSYHDTAIQARDEILKEFNEFLTKFEDRPEHLNHVLVDMDETRQKKIVPLVNKAAVTLQEFPMVEDDYKMLYNKTVKMLDTLENSKKICKLNKCRVQLLRSSFPLGAKASTPESKDYLCSTAEKVHTTVKERLLTFEREEIGKSQQYIHDHQEHLKKAIAELKINLREAAVSQFGVTMFEILNLYDDHFHFMNSLKEFNEQSYTSVLKKININIEYKLLILGSKIQNYRQYCLTCNQELRKRRFSADNMHALIETVSNSNVTNILDELINDKIKEMKTVVQAAIEHIFEEINETLNDKELVEKTVAKLKPVQEIVSKQIELEKEALEKLMKSVPNGLREHAKNVLDKANSLINTIIEALIFFRVKDSN